MTESIEARLLAEQKALYLRIKQKSTDELMLPINISQSVVGFGKFLDFYMFWISARRGTVYFFARKRFVRERTDNLVKLAFVEENQDAIFRAIHEIYDCYMEQNASGALQLELQRIEQKKAIRATIAKNREIPPAVELLWNDVTVSVFEKSEQVCHTQEDVAPETVEQLKLYGQQLSELFENLLQVMENRSRASWHRKISIYREYIQSDNVTLAAIAPKYAVSRERIRQLVNRVEDRIFEQFKRTMLLDDAETNDLVEQLAAVFEAVDYNIANLIQYGLSNLGARKKLAIFNMLFGKSLGQKLMWEGNRLTERIQTREMLRQKEEDRLEAWSFYREKICYPSSFTVNHVTPVASYEKEKSFDYETKLYKKLKKFEPILEITENPDIVYYSTSQTDHRPHFLLRLPDKTHVLVLVLPTINMAYIYNIERCNELHRFCKEHGYGYLIIDDRGNSIYDIRSRVIDPELVSSFNTILNNQTRIVWRHVKELKETRPISNADIAAYVLQNKLHFTMEPFCIKRRKNDFI